MSSHFNKAALVTASAVVILVIALTRLPAPRHDARSEPPAASPRLAELLSDDGMAGFAQAEGRREFSFPADHGPHPEFRNEWWYLTGNLESVTGRRFGYELTIFRFALAPGDGAPAESDSAWRTNQVYIAHFAITDGATGEFHVAQRMSRDSLGLAGATADPLRVWLGNWYIAGARSDSPGDFRRPWRVQALHEDIALNLTLVAEKPPVLNGMDGLSQKATAAGNASWYYSITRLATEGSLAIGDDVYRVSGLTWLDREWGSNALSDEQQGWDWYALQLSDGSDLMFYSLRKKDGSRDEHSAGTLTLADGHSVNLAHDDLVIEVLDTWESPLGGEYPVEWRMSVPRRALVLHIEPILDTQELDTAVRYWEGAVDVSGTKGEMPLTGRGYVELTGYAGVETGSDTID